jgi:hypothetical protein
MAKIFLLLATIFILANAGPLKRKFEEQIPLSGEDEGEKGINFYNEWKIKNYYYGIIEEDFCL